MEPSSTPSRQAAALLTIIALISLGISEPAAARGFAGMGRVQAIRVVPRIPVQPRALRNDVAHRQVLRVRQHEEMVPNRFRPHRLHRTAAGLFLPYAPYLIDTGQPGASPFPDGDEIGPTVVPFERAACVRPMIIEIKPVRHATHLPRVIYGRPPAC